MQGRLGEAADRQVLGGGAQEAGLHDDDEGPVVVVAGVGQADVRQRRSGQVLELLSGGRQVGRLECLLCFGEQVLQIGDVLEGDVADPGEDRLPLGVGELDGADVDLVVVDHAELQVCRGWKAVAGRSTGEPLEPPGSGNGAASAGGQAGDGDRDAGAESARADRPGEAVVAKVADGSHLGGGQGLLQPAARVLAGPAGRCSEATEHLLGVAVALLLFADLGQGSVGNDLPARQEPDRAGAGAAEVVGVGGL